MRRARKGPFPYALRAAVSLLSRFDPPKWHPYAFNYFSGHRTFAQIFAIDSTTDPRNMMV
jgi:hypothetical protein